MAELQPTYGNFKVRGIVQGLTRKNAYTDTTSDSGFQYRKLQFNVKTNKDNIVQVNLFAGKYDQVTITPKDRDKKDRKKIDWKGDIYNNMHKDWEVFMGTNVGLEQGEDGKNIRKVLTPYDATEEIFNSLEDGDVVFINGSNKFSQFESRDGDEVIKLEHEIRSIYKSNAELDFDKEDFEEISSFDQTLVMSGGGIDKKNKRIDLSTFIILNKDGDYVPYPFFVDGTKGKSLIEFGKALTKYEFGTEVKVAGKLHNRVETEAVEEEVEDDFWGERPTGYEKRQQTITNVIRELEVTGGFKDSLVEAKYSEQDFFAPAEQEQENNPFSDKGENDPFIEASDDPFDDF